MNRTLFTEVFDWFLSKITDIDYIVLTNEEFDYILKKNLLRQAITKFEKYVDSKLLEHDDSGFINKLTNIEIDIITDLMVLAWLQPKINHYKLLETTMNTSDFNKYSPANMLKAVFDFYTIKEEKLKSDIYEYTFLNHSLMEFKENG